MTSFQILLISFLIFLTSSAKSFKESTFDNENSSQDTKVTPYGLVNDRESITLYLKNDDIISISEFNKFYNPEQHHQTNFRFIKERDSDYDKKVETENNKTTLENPELKEYNEENKTDRNIEATTAYSKEESSESKSERSSITETNEIESTTTSIISQGKSIKSTEGYENDLESPEHFETTESYFKNDVSNDDKNSDTIPLRRSLFPNEKLLSDNEGEISKKTVEISNADQDTVQKSDIMNFEKPIGQSKVESTTETPVAPLPTFKTTGQASLRELSKEDTNFEHLKITPDNTPDKQSSETPSGAPQQSHPHPFIAQKQFNNLTLLPTFETTGQAGLREVSNEDTNFERLKITPDEYKQNSETPSGAPQQMHPLPFIPQKQFNVLIPLPTFQTTGQVGLREITNEDKNFEPLKITPDEFKQRSETSSVAPTQMHPHPFIPQKQFNNVTPLPTFKITGQAGLREMTNEDTNFERLKITPDEYKQSSETSSVAPQQMHPHSFIPQKQFNNLTPLPTFKITGQAGLREMSNDDTNFERLKITPDEYKQSNNLDIPKEISKNWKTIDDYNSNIYDNAYRYTPPKSISRQSLTNNPNFNSLYSKLTQASDHPFRNRVLVGQHYGNYGVIVPNFNLQNPYLQNVSPYTRNFVRRTRRYSSYNNCGQNKHKIYRN